MSSLELPLKIVVIEGRGVKSTSKGTDPFVELKIVGSDKYFKTNAKNRTLDPQWNETFTLTAKKTDFLNLKLFDFDIKSPKYKLLGEIEKPLDAFENKEQDVWWEWKEKKKKDKWVNTRGEVHIKIIFGNPPPPATPTPLVYGPHGVYPQVLTPNYTPTATPLQPNQQFVHRGSLPLNYPILQYPPIQNFNSMESYLTNQNIQQNYPAQSPPQTHHQNVVLQNYPAQSPPQTHHQNFVQQNYPPQNQQFHQSPQNQQIHQNPQNLQNQQR